MIRIFVIAWLLFVAGAVCLAQVPMTGAGLPKPAVASSYTGPANVVAAPTIWAGFRAVSGTYASGLGKIANICTPLDAVCADVNSDANGNFNLSGTGSLLCNDSTSICTVKILYDQVGTACGGSACDLLSGANRPTLKVSCTNSLPCMSCVAVNSQNMTVDASAASLAQPNTVSAVVNNQGTTGVAYFGITGGGFGNTYDWNGTNQVRQYNGANLTAAATASAWHTFQNVGNGASSDLVVDGTSNTGDSGSLGLGGGIRVCNDPYNQYFQGFVAELGIWHSAFSAGNKTAMNTNQKSYWGF